MTISKSMVIYTYVWNMENKDIIIIIIVVVVVVVIVVVVDVQLTRCNTSKIICCNINEIQKGNAKN